MGHIKNRGTATVKWSPITAAAGYRVMWGINSRSYGAGDVNVGNVLTYRITGLRSGTPYYFAAKSYNNKGTSGFSNEVRFIPR